MTVSPTDTQDDNVVSNAAEESNFDNEGVGAGNPSPQEGANADSPAADEGSKKSESLVDRIIATTERKDDGTTPDPDSEDSDEPTEGEGDSDENAEAEEGAFTQDDLKSLHSKTRKRVRKLLEKNETLQKQVSEYEPAARQYTGIMQFMKQNNLKMEDANTAFEIMADIQRNPKKALETLLPIVQDLQSMTGAVLPEDLQAQVRQGYVTEEHAKELAALRADKAHKDYSQEQAQQREQQERVAAAQQAVTSITTALASWENQWKASDPDYKALRSDVRDELELALMRRKQAGTLPKTTEEALALAEECKKRVVARVQKYRPPQKEIRHVSGSSAPSAKPEAKSLDEAILRSVNG